MSTVSLDGAPAADRGRSVDVQVLIVGAGLSGIAAAVKLRDAGITNLLVLERSHRVGGTWRDNTYPGCAVDIPSAVYSFSFRPNPRWRSNFARQDELLAYIEDTVEQFGLSEAISLGEEMLDASWDDAARVWQVRSTRGIRRARHLILACGILSEPVAPQVRGLESFPGPVFHSARWDHDVDLAGRRVAVVGTGCSAVQLIPEIQPRVGHLTVFQRTPAWVVPRLDFPIPGWLRRMFERVPFTQRAFRGASGSVLLALALLMRRPATARLLQPAGLLLLRRQVRDPRLRRDLTPRFTIGCKRLLLSNTYLPAMGRSNVTLVPQALSRVEGDRLVAADGTTTRADVLVLGSGFELRHPPFAARVRGRGGVLLAERWGPTSPRAFAGTTMPGFPNAYLLLGPNLVQYDSLLTLAELQIDYVIEAVRTMHRRGIAVTEVTESACAAYNRGVQRALATTVYNRGGCSNFYLDEHGTNFVSWPWSRRRLARRLAEFDLGDYHAEPIEGRR